MEQFLVNAPDFQTSVTFMPAATGSSPQTINGVLMPHLNKEMEWVEPTQGANKIHIFVRWADITPNPQVGDFVTINGYNYDIEKTPEVDEFGGATLHLKRNQ
jgi:hypothetical protein